jgi:hypothetical protein
MNQFTTLETPALIELLMQRTAVYTSKIAQRESTGQDLAQQEYEISLMQAELNLRTMTSENTSISDPNIKLDI